MSKIWNSRCVRAFVILLFVFSLPLLGWWLRGIISIPEKSEPAFTLGSLLTLALQQNGFSVNDEIPNEPKIREAWLKTIYNTPETDLIVDPKWHNIIKKIDQSKIHPQCLNCEVFHSGRGNEKTYLIQSNKKSINY